LRLVRQAVQVIGKLTNLGLSILVFLDGNLFPIPRYLQIRLRIVNRVIPLLQAIDSLPS
jgi:hypothetical protein